MRTVLALLLASGLVLTAAPADANDSPIGVRKPMPKTLKGLEAQLGSLQARIDELVKRANQDPAELKIAIYRKYTPKELKKTRGRVRAKDLVGFMVDKDQNFQTVREKAREALVEGARFRGDPDLSESEKQGSRTRRAAFCDKELVKFLKDDEVDRFARKLVNDLLKEFYPQGARTHPEIRIYNQDTEATWKGAHSAWKRFLKKQ